MIASVCWLIGLQSTINSQIPSSIPGGTHSDLFRMLSPTAKYFPVRSNLQKFDSLKSHQSALASSRLQIHRLYIDTATSMQTNCFKQFIRLPKTVCLQKIVKNTRNLRHLGRLPGWPVPACDTPVALELQTMNANCNQIGAPWWSSGGKMHMRSNPGSDFLAGHSNKLTAFDGASRRCNADPDVIQTHHECEGNPLHHRR